MTLYLEKLTIHYGITYLATSYLYTLKLQGWERLQSYFAGYRNRPRTNSRPCVTGESAIILPCFVEGCHWVIVVRREVEGRVLFLYADDLNSITTEANIKELLSTKTSSAFYPPSTKWIKCKNFTYRPHSNECGPRSLLAATILALHPAPSQDILMPLMHNNLAQIARTWVGSQLLQATFDEATITQFLLPNKLHWPHQTSAISEPADSIQWTSNAVTNIYQSEYAVSSKEGTANTHNILMRDRSRSREHDQTYKSSLSPLAPIFIPKQQENYQLQSKPQNALLTTCAKHRKETEIKVKAPISKKGPSKCTSFLLPGQSLLT
jgi:hypothetical protein